MSTERHHSAPGDAIVGTRPVEVRRYGALTRANHWLTAACAIVLLLSGLAFFHPSLYWLTHLFGNGQFARWLHPFVGLVMALSFFGLFVQMWRLNLPRAEDAQWVKQGRDVLTGNEEALPELGKYNAGQKLVFWGMGGLILVLLASGVMIWEQYFPGLVSIPVRRVALVAHAVAAVLMLLLLVLHVYAAIWTRGTLRAMTRGTVTGGWAWRHHRKWLRELAARERDPHQGKTPADPPAP
ncbi:formate dehydrogenase subunit gamma [Pseudoxanthomonas koreensis]|uniref:formate dehydrogenase subunit gamma n=1 Tax=Pseudoxanthomonas koreensis TaxID=266061 RepID=UPI001391E9CF|nr:formate dehydrogenase subunit gamma [Pseudoxanthomonas koreensis]KAF1689887.1 formate dehydrogenase subunit gamma [Pseudoxanthomonas koreensis]